MSKMFKHAEEIYKYLHNRDWTSPTEIGNRVGGEGKHSSWASPKMKKMCQAGTATRSDNGWYKLTPSGEKVAISLIGGIPHE